MENEQKKIAAYIYDLEPAEGNAQQEIPLILIGSNEYLKQLHIMQRTGE